jgi:hypothetical protein
MRQNQQMGAIAFRVDLKAIGVLRKDPVRSEAFLLEQAGKA